MTKTEKKKFIRVLKKSKNKKAQKKAAEYVNYLLELHKLQGVILKRLEKEI